MTSPRGRREGSSASARWRRLTIIVSMCVGVVIISVGCGQSRVHASSATSLQDRAGYPKPIQKPLDTRPNHVPNPSFEETNEKGIPVQWQTDDPRAGTDSFAFSGKRAAIIHSDPTEIKHLICKVTNGQELVGKSVELSCAAYIPRATDKGGPFSLMLTYVAAGKEKSLENIAGAVARWNIVKVSGEIPEDAVTDSLRVILSIRPSVIDAAILDDVQLVLKK